MNIVALTGRLTKDPEIRAAGETTIATFTLAVNRMKKDEADFIRCKAFNKTAEIVEKYLTKGREAALNGRIETGSYKNKSGDTVYTTEVVVERLTLIGGKEDKPKQEYRGFTEDEDNSIPF